MPSVDGGQNGSCFEGPGFVAVVHLVLQIIMDVLQMEIWCW